MFSSMCSLKSSMSPRSSASNLPSLKKDHLLSTFEKQNHQYYGNDNIHIQRFNHQYKNTNFKNSLKFQKAQRSQSQESFGQAIRDRLSFQKKDNQRERLSRFKSTQTIDRMNRLNLVKSVDKCDITNSTTLQCSNLDNKRAKYYILNSKQHIQKYYCSKCSIMLLQKGYQISQIKDTNCISINKVPQNNYPYRAQIQQLNTKLNRLQMDTKSQISNLEHNYFFLRIQQSKQKIQQTYNKIIQLIVKMKQQDLKQLKIAKQYILKQTQTEKKTLINISKSIQTKKDELSSFLFSFPSIDQNQYKIKTQQILLLLQNNKRHKSLQFNIRQQNEDKLINRIVEEIKNKLMKVVEFSFDNFNNYQKEWNYQKCQNSFSEEIKQSFQEMMINRKGTVKQQRQLENVH